MHIHTHTHTYIHTHTLSHAGPIHASTCEKNLGPHNTHTHTHTHTQTHKHTNTQTHTHTHTHTHIHTHTHTHGTGDSPPWQKTHPEYADFTLTNGQFVPHLTLPRGGVRRLRVMNAAASMTYELALQCAGTHSYYCICLLHMFTT
jgi:hypothetical protein